jgi:hypothetical protein
MSSWAHDWLAFIELRVDPAKGKRKGEKKKTLENSARG